MDALTIIKTLLPAPRDGLTAREYTEIRYALSADQTTASATQSPTIVGEWSDVQPVPNSAQQYVWMRSRRMVPNSAGTDYVVASVSYLRVNGKNGTSITVKGDIVGYEVMPDARTGPEGCYIFEGDPVVYMYRSDAAMGYYIYNSWQAAVNDGYVHATNHHLYVWNGSDWSDCGIFRGDNGASAYVHFGWALALDQTANGKAYPSDFDTVRDDSKEYAYMGVCTNNSPNAVADGRQYEWTYIKGTAGKDAVLYQILPSVGYLLADAQGVIQTPSVEVSVTKTEGDVTTQIVTVSSTSSYVVRYKVDSGSWRNCTTWTEDVPSPIPGALASIKLCYGVPHSALVTGMKKLKLRLETSGGDVLAEMPEMTVVKNGAKGDKGDTGPSLRGPQNWEDCVVGFSFMQGGDDERFLDCVIHNGNYYECKKSHVKADAKEPGVSQGWETYWRLGDKFDIVATKILLATFAIIKNLGVEYVQVGGTSAYLRDSNGEIVILDSENNVKFRAKATGVECNTGTFNNVQIQSGKIAGFTISGTGMVNEGFSNDAYIIFRNDNRKAFAGIGGNVLPASSGIRAVGRFENEDQNDYWSLGANYALFLSAKNASRNYAFYGQGNGLLSGWVGGWKFKKLTLTQNPTNMDLYESNVFFVTTSLTSTPILLLPLLNTVQLLIGDYTTSFCIRMSIHGDLFTKNFQVGGRSSTRNSENLPLLVNEDTGRHDTVTVAKGDSLELLLVYDKDQTTELGGFTTKYTARIVNKQA